MPGGRTHQTMTIGAAVVTAGAMAYAGFPTSEILACSTGYLVSLWVNPDLDLNPRLVWRSPKKLLWQLVWYPYAKLIPHRGILSHFPLIGTAVRLLYFFLPAYILLLLMGASIQVAPRSLEWMLFGLALSDTLHVLADVFSTSLKRRRK
ncbi:MAG TPA: DUF2227 family putative metal-binding protein [Bellilinea sp.]|nr:DUF2227 family putative metal-binding protein [Bellilinea sp.]